ncbi:MAG: ABC transporter permease [Anaerolineaceae bacterium]|nr:ABC transporter permease [Anaerolineaceae bacterium]
MTSRRQWFTVLLSFLASLALFFVILPLAVTVLATQPSELWMALSDGEVLRSIGTTFLAGTIATGIGFFLGVPLAWVLARRQFPAKGLVEGIVTLPVIIPHTAAGIALLMVFGSRGVLGSPLQKLGIFFVDQLAGVVVAMLFVGLPFLVTASREAFAAIDIEMEKAAMIDGASHWQTFVHITLPQAWRGVTAGAMMMWARGISEFGAVAILAYHPKIVPVLVFERFQGFGLNAARPIAVILILAVLVVYIGLRLIANFRRK